MQHEGHRVPVTALALLAGPDHGKVILAGEGHILKAYDVQRHDLLDTQEVFQDQAIHGILVQDSANLLIWGGALVCSGSVGFNEDGSLRVTLGEAVKTTDWILDASFSPSIESLPRAILVTAHNALLLCDEQAGTLTPELTQLVPGSNCILYAAHITRLSPSKCLIASGTAFGDVILWSCSLDQEEHARSIVHYTFSAHDGSVFGVQTFSPSASFTMGDWQHVLATCSDDRTIRLWDVSDLSRSSPALSDVQFETGFGARPTQNDTTPPLIAKVMAHQSRIWQVRFLTMSERDSLSDTPSQGYVLSFGEDATCILWVLARSDDGVYSLQQVQIQQMHVGKNIWSVAVDSGGDTATGGADGAIAFLRNHLVQQNLPRRNDVPLHRSDEKPANFKSYVLVSAEKLIAVTEDGRICEVLLGHADDMKIHQLSPETSGLRGYSTIVKAGDTIFVAGKDGKVFSLNLGAGNALSHIADTNGKVAGLFAQAFQSDEWSECTKLIAINVGGQTARLFQVPPLDGNAFSEPCDLPLPQGFIVTSFAYLRDTDREVVILASRNGSIALYRISRLSDSASGKIETVSTVVHGKEAITSCHAIKSSLGDSIIFTAGRDGTLAAHKVVFAGDQYDLKTIHQLALPFGPNIEGIGISPSDHLCVWGFRSKQFVVFDITAQQEIMTVECGGAHRNWSFLLGREGGTFVWTKASQLCFQPQSDLPVQKLNSGGHGREIKSVAVCNIAGTTMVATGAEDTNIKLSTYDRGSLRCVHTLRKHNTGIQDLQWSRDGKYLFSSGGFEEFFVWRIHHDVPFLGFGVVCESAHPNSGRSDLRIMGFCVKELRKGDLDDDEDLFEISMVYSDSALKVWRYENTAWTLLAQGDYLTACLTHCHPLNDDHSQLLTAGTDGHLAQWAVDQEDQAVNWSSRHPVHQNAILCLASHSLSDGRSLVFTGGDDNAIGITLARSSIRSLKSLLLTRAHAAAVTGIAVLHSDSEKLWFVSASLDQRVKIWCVDFSENAGNLGIGNFKIACVANQFTAVADVSGVEVTRQPDGQLGLLVCGIGVDLWNVEDELWG